MKTTSSKQRKIEAIKDLAAGRGLPQPDGPVIALKDGRFYVTRMGKEYIYTKEEFDKLTFKRGPMIMPDNGRDPITFVILEERDK